MIFWLVVVALLLSHGSIFGATRYSSPGGSGTACSSGSPCSVSEGLDQTNAGDTLIFKDGTYNQDLWTVRSGTSANPITLQAENRRQATFVWPRGDNHDSHVWVRHSHIRLTGIVADCTGGSGSAWNCVRVERPSSSGPYLPISLSTTFTRMMRAIF